METNDFLSYIGAMGSVAAVIALFPEKNRMSFFNFLKKASDRLIGFVRKVFKTVRLRTIQTVSKDGQTAVGTFQIKVLKPIAGVTVSKQFPSEYTLFELVYHPEAEVFPFGKITSNIPLFEAYYGNYWSNSDRHVLTGAFERDIAIKDQTSTDFTYDFAANRSILLLAPQRDISEMRLTITGPGWLKPQIVSI